jgi:hypothetical protein
MRIIPKETYGIVENLIASFIFFSPNLMMFFSYMRDNYHVFLVYNFGVMFLILSTLSHFRFSEKSVQVYGNEPESVKGIKKALKNDKFKY